MPERLSFPFPSEQNASVDTSAHHDVCVASRTCRDKAGEAWSPLAAAIWVTVRWASGRFQSSRASPSKKARPHTLVLSAKYRYM